MNRELGKTVITTLWEKHKQESWQFQHIEKALHSRGVTQLYPDHFAIIDLPGPHSGIPQLINLFSTLGYEVRGKGYLAAKQNDFVWLAPQGCNTMLAHQVLPQVVVADFRLSELPLHVRTIIEKYAQLSPPLTCFTETALTDYFTGRDWPLPTLQEYQTVHAFNELLAWVLLFGRKPNHFTLAIHLLNHFVNLHDFLVFLRDDLHLPLNQEGGVIKGTAQIGIEQGSTVGHDIEMVLPGGKITVPHHFVEFVWRYPMQGKNKATLWEDYFTDFIPQHADRVIESLYTSTARTLA